MVDLASNSYNAEPQETPLCNEIVMFRVPTSWLHCLFRQERSFASKVQKRGPDFTKKGFKSKRKPDKRDIRDIDERLLPVVSLCSTSFCMAVFNSILVAKEA